MVRETQRAEELPEKKVYVPEKKLRPDNRKVFLKAKKSRLQSELEEAAKRHVERAVRIQLVPGEWPNRKRIRYSPARRTG